MKNRKKYNLLLALAAIGLLGAGRASAYEVGFSLAQCSTNAYFALNTWSNVCARADENNNFLGGWNYDPLDPDQVDGPCNNQQWQVIINNCSGRDNCSIGWARSNVSRNTNIVDATAYPYITNLLATAFANAAQYNYSYDMVGFYDDAVTNPANGVYTYYNWDTTEVQYLRNWLDANGHTNVLIDYDARNNGQTVRSWCNNSLVTAVLLEANPTLWFTDQGSRQELIQWLVSNSVTAGKKIVFQIPPDGTPNPYGVTNNIMIARNLLVWMGNFMGYDFMRRTNVAFKPVTYNSPDMQFFPEMTPDGGQYTNTMTSLNLSLIEQRAFFEGRTGVQPATAGAYNLSRNPDPTISAIPNQVTTNGSATAAIPFSVGSQAVPGASLTVVATSSSASLVPATNIVINTWSSIDLGSVGVPGTNLVGDVTTMNASGAGFSGPADSGSFIYQPQAGDGSMVVRVTAVQPVSGGSAAGLMMRAGTNAGSVDCFISLGATTGIEFGWRGAGNGATSSNGVAGITAPCWLKLVKSGTSFAGYYAPDHLGWPGTWVPAGSSVTISGMSSNLLSGLAGASGNNGVAGTFAFDNLGGNTNRSVTITPAANQSGIATITLVVSDGWYTATNAFNLAVSPAGPNTPPTIGNLPVTVTLNENAVTNVAFTVGDSQSAPDALLVTGSSSNPGLISNASVVIGGSGAARLVTLAPVPQRSGSATITLVVSDGFLSATNTFAVIIPTNSPPAIGNLTGSATMNENSTGTVSFTVSDANVPLNSLSLSAYSSNGALVPNANLIFGGSGANRTVTITPAAYQIGTNTISLVVSDGVINATNDFLLSVVPPAGFITAVASGDINDPKTWGGTVPVRGDTNIWQTGSQTVNMTSSAVDTFYGNTFVVQTGGMFYPLIANAALTLNNLVLAGGEIICDNNGGLNLNLSGQTFTLNSGSLVSGGSGSGGRDVIFKSGALAGNGVIAVTGSSGNSFYVQFQSSVSTTNFSGSFRVQNNGTLYLPAIAVTNASFGMSLTAPSQYQNSGNVALTSLVIDGASIPPGAYNYTALTNLGASLVSSAGIVTVATVLPTYPVLAPIANQTLISGQMLVITNLATDADYPPPTLTYNLVGAPDGLNGVPPGMTINPTNGILAWRPTLAAASLGAFTIGVQVSNNENPPLVTEQDFSITVNPPAAPALSGWSQANGQFTFTVSGDYGPDYIVLTSSNLVTWQPLETNYSPAVPFTITASNIVNNSSQFYQIQLGP